MSQTARPAPVDKELYKRFQKTCIDQDRPVRDALEDAIRMYISTSRGEA